MAIDFPDSPSNGDTFTVLGKTWAWNGESWKVTGSAVRGISLKISDTAPSSPAPVEGDMWYESDTGRTFTYYDSVWVELGNTASVTSFLADADSDTRIHVEETADEDTIRFDTAGVERLTIGPTGDVDVVGDLTVGGDFTVSGTTTTLNTTELLVEDNKITLNSGATGSASVDAGIEVERGDDPNVEILWDESVDAWKIATDFTVDAGTLHVDSTNNWVGIGTTTPDNKLHVQRNGSSAPASVPASHMIIADSGDSSGSGIAVYTPSDGFGYIRFGDPDNGASGGLSYGHTGDKLFLRAGGTDSMTIDSSGNVGIGTTSPSVKLHVKGAAANDTTAEMIIQGNGSMSFHGSLGQGSFNGIVNAGDMGIIFTDGTQGTGEFVIAPWASGTGGIRINSSGDVGIGQASPSYRLDVAGDINATGAVRDGGVALIDGYARGSTGTINVNQAAQYGWYWGATTFTRPSDLATTSWSVVAIAGNSSGNVPTMCQLGSIGSTTATIFAWSVVQQSNTAHLVWGKR